MSEFSEVPELGQQTIDSAADFNVDVFSGFLKAKIPDLVLPVKIKKFASGQSNPTFKITDAKGRALVVRRKPPGELVSDTAHQVDREFRVLNALCSTTSLPVPKVYFLEEDRSIAGAMFYVMDFLEGRIFTDTRLLKVPLQDRREIYISCARTFARMHKVDPKACGLAGQKGFHKIGDFYPRQLRTWSQIHAAQRKVKYPDGALVPQIERFDDIVAWLQKNMIPDEIAIVHGDSSLHNVIVHNTEPRIIGILDWELSTIGHPLADVATLLGSFFQQPGAGGPLTPTSPAINRGPGYEEHDPVAYLRAYADEAGRSLEGVWGVWDFCMCFSRLKSAVIMQGIAVREARGQASSTFAKAYAAMVPGLNKQAIDYMERGVVLKGKGKL
ncbi:hypothetical protein HDU93_008131 [Gonapodya sp. JEL0774]|nr:hypothetical protein HDU93_008131 [Gonapodya sp. JEL0774]